MFPYVFAGALGAGIFFASMYGAGLTFAQAICVLIIYLAMTAMAAFNVASDLAMFSASVLLLATDVITREDFLQGFGNSSVVCVGLLLVVAKGVEETGALERLVKFCLGKPKGRIQAQLVMMLPVLLISAFLSNTACVAMMIPIIQSWSDSIGQNRSQLLLPLSYVSMMGGSRLLEACVVTVCLQIYMKIMTLEEAWSAVKGGTLLTIASSFSLGTAIQSSGLADIIADDISYVAKPFGNIGLLAVVYFVTSFLSILVSNTAVVVFLFDPVAKAAQKADMDLLPFVFILMIGSSAAYATPISYQTNLMVFSPGGYTFNDYLRFGGPLQIVSWMSTVLVTWLIFLQ